MHEEEYKGHQITVDTIPRGKNWTATYQIDGGEIHNIGDRPLPSEEIVRGEAISAAKWAIDHMKPK